MGEPAHRSSSPVLRAAGTDTCIGEEIALGFAAGHLDSATLSLVDAHVDGCPACQELIAAAVGTSSSGAPRRTHFTSGDPVAGRYRIVRFLGAGGMGEVYEAEDEMLSEHIALKCLSPALADSSRAIAYLKSEVQLARRVSHPNVCRVFDVGVHGGPGTQRDLHFLSMQLCPGETLGQRARRGSLPAQDTLEIARQLLLGLAEAHRAGILHRDFKSDNIILLAHDGSESRKPHAVITDFGLARAFEGQDPVTTSHVLVGSAPYMAPEQVEGKPLTEAVDIYGFGVVVFEMLTGSLPFIAQTPVAVALQRLRRAAPKPSERNPAVSAGWDAFVAGCLARETEQRFASAQEALSELERLVGSGAQTARRPGRRKLLAVCAALSATTLGAVWLLATAGDAPRSSRLERAGAMLQTSLDEALLHVRWPDAAVPPTPTQPDLPHAAASAEAPARPTPPRARRKPRIVSTAAASNVPATEPAAPSASPAREDTLDQLVDPFD